MQEANQRLPLFRSIAIELKDRVDALHALAEEPGEDAHGEARRLRDRVRECVVELEVLGAEVEGFRPITLALPAQGRTGGLERLTWQLGEPAFQREGLA